MRSSDFYAGACNPTIFYSTKRGVIKRDQTSRPPEVVASLSAFFQTFWLWKFFEPPVGWEIRWWYFHAISWVRPIESQGCRISSLLRPWKARLTLIQGWIQVSYPTETEGNSLVLKTLNPEHISVKVDSFSVRGLKRSRTRTVEWGGKPWFIGIRCLGGNQSKRVGEESSASPSLVRLRPM